MRISVVTTFALVCMLSSQCLPQSTEMKVLYGAEFGWTKQQVKEQLKDYYKLRSEDATKLQYAKVKKYRSTVPELVQFGFIDDRLIQILYIIGSNLESYRALYSDISNDYNEPRENKTEELDPDLTDPAWLMANRLPSVQDMRLLGAAIWDIKPNYVLTLCNGLVPIRDEIPGVKDVKEMQFTFVRLGFKDAFEALLEFDGTVGQWDSTQVVRDSVGSYKTWNRYKGNNIVFTEFHTNGAVKCKGQRIDGKREGTWIWWYDNGVKESKGTYSAGLANGRFTDWAYNGNIQSETDWKNDIQHGIRVEYKDGRLVSEAEWKNGVMDGACREFNPYSGAITSTVYWKEGKRIESPMANLGKSWNEAVKKGGSYFIGKWIGDGTHPQYGKVYVEINVSVPNKEGICRWSYEVVVPSAKNMGGTTSGRLVLSQVNFSTDEAMGKVSLTPSTGELSMLYLPNEGWVKAVLPIGPNFAKVILKKY
ncbi:MAG: hypothetical protein M5R41_19170 [Bacteroidia bacterium]|nr:hypothetical protein [Bacteroidia bacterium]